MIRTKVYNMCQKSLLLGAHQGRRKGRATGVHLPQNSFHRRQNISSDERIMITFIRFIRRRGCSILRCEWKIVFRSRLFRLRSSLGRDLRSFSRFCLLFLPMRALVLPFDARKRTRKGMQTAMIHSQSLRRSSAALSFLHRSLVVCVTFSCLRFPSRPVAAISRRWEKCAATPEPGDFNERLEHISA